MEYLSVIFFVNSERTVFFSVKRDVDPSHSPFNALLSGQVGMSAETVVQQSGGGGGELWNGSRAEKNKSRITDHGSRISKFQISN